MSNWKLPGKGLVTESSNDDLDYWGRRIANNLAAGTARNPGLDTKLLEAIRAEQLRRDGSGRAAAPAQQNAASHTQRATLAPLEEIVGTLVDSSELNKRLAKAAEQYNLISPATSVGNLPMGIAISITVVPVNIEADTYNLQGKFGLSKHVLDKIAMQLGISWDARQSGRLDDGSDPRYCSYRVVGSYLSLDARELFVSGEKELDLRDGSPQVLALQEQARRKAQRDRAEVRDIQDQLSELRLHIMSHCATKARNRAIRTFGVKAAYTESELQRPFVAVRPMFTGHSDDPVIRQLFAQRIAEQFLGGKRALYGSSPNAPVAQPLERRPPPPRAGGLDDDDFVDARGEPMDERDADRAYENWASEQDRKDLY